MIASVRRRIPRHRLDHVVIEAAGVAPGHDDPDHPGDTAPRRARQPITAIIVRNSMTLFSFSMPTPATFSCNTARGVRASGQHRPRRVGDLQPAHAAARDRRRQHRPPNPNSEGRQEDRGDARVHLAYKMRPTHRPVPSCQ